MSKTVMVRVTPQLREKLKELKPHPRVSYSEIISKLVKSQEKD